MTLRNFVAMAAATAVIIAASGADSLTVFTAGFVLLSTLTGTGNGSAYEMMPAIITGRATTNIAAGADPVTETAMARRLSGAVIGIVGVVGALGGFINLAFRESFQAAGTGRRRSGSSWPSTWSASR